MHLKWNQDSPISTGLFHIPMHTKICISTCTFFNKPNAILKTTMQLTWLMTSSVCNYCLIFKMQPLLSSKNWLAHSEMNTCVNNLNLCTVHGIVKWKCIKHTLYLSCLFYHYTTNESYTWNIMLLISILKVQPRKIKT